MKNPNDKNVIPLEPGTVVAIAALLILLPLLITGFWAQ